MGTTTHYLHADGMGNVVLATDSAGNKVAEYEYTSFGEEFAVGTVLWLAFAHPVTALVVLAMLVLLMLWLIPKVWRMLRKLVDRAIGWIDRSHRPTGP